MADEIQQYSLAHRVLNELLSFASIFTPKLCIEVCCIASLLIASSNWESISLSRLKHNSSVIEITVRSHQSSHQLIYTNSCI